MGVKPQSNAFSLTVSFYIDKFHNLYWSTNILGSWIHDNQAELIGELRISYKILV